MKVGIIGCGFIGAKRSQNIGGHELVAVADTAVARAEKLASQYTAEAFQDWRKVAEHKEIDIVCVSTTHDNLASITHACVEAGKHVLVDKPAARRAHELEPAIRASMQNGKLVRVGFNHRYHPAMLKAKEIIEAGEIGPLMFLRGRYGHGGRPGYDKEWRADPQVGGGGELLDQGMHLIDLSRWYLGDFDYVDGRAATFFWDMQVDDNAFMMLRTKHEQVAWLHVSWTEWKNLFSLEIYGRDGKLQIDGLGGSYGLEQLSYYKMLPQMGPPETTIWQYPGADKSWEIEFNEFLKDIDLGRQPNPGLKDAYEALKVVEKIYKLSDVKAFQVTPPTTVASR